MFRLYYPQRRFEHETEEEVPPPKYEDQSGLQQVPTSRQREYTFSILIWTSNVLCFMSPDAAAKYNSFKKISKRDASFKHVIDLQQLGIGLPLMEAQFKQVLGRGEVKFATIFKYVPPPPGSKRTFNKKKDRFEFCTVVKKDQGCGTRYTFTIQPYQNDPFDTFQFSMFWHEWSFIDVSPIRGSHRRYRWINSIPRRYREEEYNYSLYSLEEKQKSIVDNMDVANRKLDKANSALNAVPILFPKEKINGYKFMDGAGELVTKDRVAQLTREKHLKITMSTFKKGNKLLHVSQSHHVNESINSVSVHELALACMSCVINYVEDYERHLETR